MTGSAGDQRGRPNASAWRLRVLGVLAAFPGGASIALLARPLADGTRSYDAVYASIRRALQACERHGLARRTGPTRARVRFTWNNDPTIRTFYGTQAVYWQVTHAGADYLARYDQEGRPVGDSCRTSAVIRHVPAGGAAR